MEYLTVRQTAEKWGVTPRWVQVLLKSGRIPGAIRPARDWLIPKDTEKPRDTRGDWHKKVKTPNMTDKNITKIYN